MLTRIEPDHYNDERQKRLEAQGERITQAIAPHGYLCRRLENQLAWEVTRVSDDWFAVLMFLPRPVQQWRLLPHNPNCPYQKEIYSSIEFVLRQQQSHESEPTR